MRDDDHDVDSGADSDSIGGDGEAVFRLPIEDALDLHAFHPRDVKVVVEEYLDECQRRGFGEVRIIHGRGTGVQRSIVRATLERSRHVLAFRDAAAERGGWGATVVELKPPDSSDSSDSSDSAQSPDSPDSPDSPSSPDSPDSAESP